MDNIIERIQTFLNKRRNYSRRQIELLQKLFSYRTLFKSMNKPTLWRIYQSLSTKPYAISYRRASRNTLIDNIKIRLNQLLEDINLTEWTNRPENGDLPYIYEIIFFSKDIADAEPSYIVNIMGTEYRLIKKLILQMPTNQPWQGQVGNYLMKGINFGNDDFNHLIKLLHYNNPLMDEEQWFVNSSIGIDALIIKDITQRIPDDTNMNYERFEEDNFRDIQDKFINSEFIKYKINKHATSFDELIDNPICEYVTNNFKKNSCFVTLLVNVFQEHIKNLTYEKVCEICNIDCQDTDIGLSIAKSLEFFKKYGVGLDVYNVFGKLIYQYIHTENGKEKRSKLKNIRKVRILLHDNHTYFINDFNSIDRIKHKRYEYEEDTEYKKLDDEDELSMDYPIYHKKDEDFIHFVDNLDEAVKYIIDKDTEKECLVKIVYSGDLTELLFKLKFEYQWTMQVKYDSKLLSLSFTLDKLRVVIISADVGKPKEPIHIINNPDKYTKYHQLYQELYEKLINHKYMSHYSTKTLKFNQLYRKKPLQGHLNLSYGNVIDTIDQSKAYTTCLYNMDKIPVYEVFDEWTVISSERHHLINYEVDIPQHYSRQEEFIMAETGQLKEIPHSQIEDYTEYLVRRKGSKNILLSEEISRLYGFCLRKIDRLEYDIIAFRRPSKLIDVNLKPMIDKIINQIGLSSTKQICNEITGLLEKKKQTKTYCYVFTNPSEAHYYHINYDNYQSEILPFTHNDNKIYAVTTKKETQLHSGFVDIKNMIYDMCHLRLYELYERLIELKIPVLSIKTDSIGIPKGLYNEETIKPLLAEFKFGKEINTYNFECDKDLPTKPLFVKTNIEIRLYDDDIKVDTLTNEYDKDEIIAFYDKNKRAITKGNCAGSGKTTSLEIYCKNKNTLFICPHNDQVQEFQMKGNNAMTYSTAFARGIAEERLGSMKVADFSQYEVIVLDEIFKPSITYWRDIYRAMKKHSNIRWYATGDIKQIKEFVTAYNNVPDYQEYREKCMNKLFSKQLLLTKVKRGFTEDDNKEFEELEKYMYSKSNVTIHDLISKFNLKHMKDWKSLNCHKNIAFSRLTKAKVNNYYHKRLYGSSTHIEKGLHMKCFKHYQAKGLRFYVNYVYKIVDITDNDVIFEDINDNTKQLPFKRSNLFNNFTWDYCMTIHASQGKSLCRNTNDMVALYDLDSPYVDKNLLYVALTRARSLKNVVVVLNEEDTIDYLRNCRVKLEFKLKCQDYLRQDNLKNRHIENFVDADWILNKLNECSWLCGRCNEHMFVSIQNGKVITDVSVDRIDNDKCHSKDNCMLSHTLCNCSASNH